MMIETKIDFSEADGLMVFNQWDEINGARMNHMTQIINLKDRLVREKLIELGWTPPKKEAPAGEDRGQWGEKETTTKNEPSV